MLNPRLNHIVFDCLQLVREVSISLQARAVSHTFSNLRVATTLRGCQSFFRGSEKCVSFFFTSGLGCLGSWESWIRAKWYYWQAVFLANCLFEKCFALEVGISGLVSGSGSSVLWKLLSRHVRFSEIQRFAFLRNKLFGMWVH